MAMAVHLRKPVCALLLVAFLCLTCSVSAHHFDDDYDPRYGPGGYGHGPKGHMRSGITGRRRQGVVHDRQLVVNVWEWDRAVGHPPHSLSAVAGLQQTVLFPAHARMDDNYVTCLDQKTLWAANHLHKLVAHFIKDRRCNTARAIFALESEYKWALSGTPLQNRVGELYSLIRFLQIFPYPNYFCKDCNCEILDTSMKKQCDCGHSSVRHFCWWNKAADHPYLVAYSKTAGPREGFKNEGNESMKSQCGICHNVAEDVVVTSCDHAFCKTCLMDYSATLGNVSCPSCSVPLTVDLTTKGSVEKVTPSVKGRKCSGILSRLASLEDFKTSTKIDALISITDLFAQLCRREEIRNMIEHDGSAKGIVFSQFTSFLDLIQFSLEKSGIKCVQLNGAMNITEKGRAIDTFTNDPDCRIFLMSLKAGGVALNLTVASHVFLMDPWWNPAVESQAQDRIHRIGQFKPIKSTRFVIKDTVEERILQLQEKKQLVFEGTVGDSPDAMSKLTEADLKFLFQI
ncbi:hypothetical protein C2845_PM04G25850 [Panicum miliaceum]|uniref:ATP-dependent helicase rhp16-like n=1 Tax=Panicum miliaceum TaxID=4540 RepID=A0A3L6QNB5_PANMI|nr:hypothetical protein C2845_PM04G25850 [Panicum miliaceum]